MIDLPIQAGFAGIRPLNFFPLLFPNELKNAGNVV